LNLKKKKEIVKTGVKELKDILVSLQTFEEADISTETEIINGKLYAIIVDVNKPVHLKISLVNYPKIVLYDNKHCGGGYLPLRVDSLNKSHERYNFAPSMWCLNDALKITMRGQKDANLKVVIRHG